MTDRSLDLDALLGGAPKRSDWVVVDQPLINAFADATGDHQPIHVDPVIAAKSPFGGTIAHGFLTLSLLAGLFTDAVGAIGEGETGINYGLDRVRFLTPVPCGARVRGVFALERLEDVAPGTRKATWNASVEIEGADRPAVVATWINMWVAAPST